MTSLSPTPGAPGLDALAAVLRPNDPARLLPLAGTFNFRDVGGYPVEGGRSLRHGRLFRSDAMGELSDDDLEVLRGRGLRSILDLRETYEMTASPDRLEGLEVASLHVPVFADSLFADGFDHITEPITLERLYEMMLTQHAVQLARAVTVLGEADRLPLVVHCTAGKDRTGMVTALVLGAVGVPDEWIVDDFTATESFLGEAFVARVEAHYARNGFPASMASHPTRAPAELIVGALARIRDAHGSVEGFLRDHGAEADAIARLKDELVEEAR